MNDCPTRDRLEELLAERLMAPEQDALEGHVSACVACQQLLERLTEIDSLVRGPAGDLAQSHCCTGEENRNGSNGTFLDRMKQALPMFSAGWGDEGDETRPGDLTSAAQAAQTQIGRTWPQVPGYEVVGELGRGGMGVVYRARQTGLNRDVALKMILTGTHASKQELARFRAEAEAAARLQHPNIVQIYEVGEHEGCPYLSFELVEGGSLAQRAQGAPLPPRQTAELTETLARTMHVAHQRGIIHRDLKPANVLLQIADCQVPMAESHSGVAEHRQSQISNLQSIIPKIADFGLAKCVDVQTAQTQSGAILGTPSYMAPEQAGGPLKEVGPHTDVYALGTILYELLTGRPPFRAPTPVETLLQVQSGEPVAPSRLQPKVPADLETICLKCLQKQPAKRYVSALDLAEDLRRFLAGEPIRARRTGPLGRATRWCRRNPTSAVLLASVAACLVVIAAGALITAMGLRRERDLARDNLDRAELAEADLRRERDQALDLVDRTQRAESDTKQAHKDALDKLWDSCLARARAGRWSGQLGQRFQGLEALAQAAAIRPSFDLRNEAIACMALMDLRVERRWNVPREWVGPVTFDRRLERYACCPPVGEIRVHRASDDRELLRLPGAPGRKQVVQTFSPDGRFLVVKYFTVEHGEASFQIWDLERRQRVLDLNTEQGQGAIDFSPDSTRIAINRWFTSVAVYELPGGREVRVLDLEAEPTCVAFDAVGLRLAAGTTFQPLVRVWAMATGKEVAKLAPPAGVHALAWRPDGRLLAASCADSRVHVWDMRGLQPLSDLQGHQSDVVKLAFSPDGNVLVSRSWDGTTRLWDPVAGRQLLSVPEDFRGFHPDGRLAFEGNRDLGIWQVSSGPEFHNLYHHLEGNRVSGRPALGPFGADFSPDGRLLVSSGLDGVWIWDLATGRKVGFLPLPNCLSVHFLPGDGDMLTYSSAGLRLWPVRTEPVQGGKNVRIGPPVSLGVAGNPVPAISRACWGAKGQLLAAANGRGFATVVNVRRPAEVVVLKDVPGADHIALSPDGKWVATSTASTSTAKGSGTRIWNATGGERVQDLPGGDACVAFSPDGKWLVTGTSRTYTFWALGLGRWLPVRSIPRTQGGMQGPIAFSRDSRVLAIARSLRSVQLIDAATGSELATLTAPEPQLVTWLVFNAEGTRLAATTENHTIQLWDLRYVRGQLAAMGLDWEQPRYPAGPNDPPAPVHVIVDLGTLATSSR